MIIKEIIEELKLNQVSGEKDSLKTVNGVYICDLLSWVMANGSKGDIWITVQTHLNIIAVASLLEIPMIIVPESIEIEEETLAKADEENIVVCTSELDSFTLACNLNELGLK
ncbi:MAG: AraC family transcriptional regulator [Peptostreptococcaceae bacterium]|nr:AraC family transcriptional regulator [Peptostreptococcaceae bacterium]